MTKEAKSNGNGARYPRVAGNDTMDVLAVRNERYSPTPVSTIVHSRLGMDAKAQFAMACIEKWAMVAAEPDGEDSHGRQRGRRMTAAEVAKHACDCADETFREFAARGWTFPTPSYEQMIDAVKDIEDAND